MILSVTLNPCIDHAVFVRALMPHDANRVIRVERDAGGKGINLSRVVAELGGETVATGFLGGGTGNLIKHVLDDQGADHRFVTISGETRVNFSVEDESDEPPTTFNERGPKVSESELDELRSALPDMLGKARWMAVGGSMPPGIPEDFYAELVALARQHGVKVMVDADGPAMARALEAKPDVIKPNTDEAERLLGRELGSFDAAVDAARELYAKLDGASSGLLPAAIVSRGEDGAILACREGAFNGIPPKVDVRSTIGSGDSLLGGFLFALERGDTIENALRLGIACGAATATTSGSEIARVETIKNLLTSVRIERLG